MIIDREAGQGFHIGDIVTPTCKILDRLKANDEDITPLDKDWEVFHVGRGGVTYLRSMDLTETGLQSKYLELVRPVQYDRTRLIEAGPLPGQTVKILPGAEYASHRFVPGQYGEIAAVDLNGTIMVHQDYLPDAIGLGRDYFEIVDATSEYDCLEKARQLAPRKNHAHKWEFRWGDTNRYCNECGVSQWSLRCWTGDGWRFKTPRGILIERPDLERSKFLGTENFIEPLPRPTEPFRTRSSSIISEEALRTPITMIGAGGIGSFAMVPIMKMGFRNVTIFDPDVVDTPNIGTQLYGNDHCGSRKVDALRSILEQLGPRYMDGATFDMVRYAQRYNRNSQPGIVVMGVDSMAARKEIWERIKSTPGATTMVIDGRMGAENALMYAMNPNDPHDVESYERTLYTDEQAVNEPCTARGTVYTGQLLGGMITKTIKDIVMNKPYPRIMMWDIENNDQKIFIKNR